MIKSFRDKNTERLYITGECSKFPSEVSKVGIRKLDYLNSADQLQDLRVPPGNRLETLRGNYKGKHSIRINDQFRVVFKFENGDAYEVEVVDYH